MADLRGGSLIGGKLLLGKSGTTNYIPKFNADFTIGNSLIYDNGTNIGLGTITPTQKLEVNGNVKAITFYNSSGTEVSYSNHNHTLDSLSNTTITSNSAGEILKWNGSAWINNTLAEAGIAPVSSPTFTGTPLSTTAAVDTNTTQIATTAFVIGQASSSNPVMNGTVAIGTSLRYARADHVHPTDTSRAPLASPTFTGIPAAPTAVADTNTTQLATTAFVIGQGYLKSSTASTTYLKLDGTNSMTGSLKLTGAAGTGFILDTPGTGKGRMFTLPGVANWVGTAVNASFNGSGWVLDDTTLNGWFYKLDSRSGLSEFALYKVPAGAGTHIDEYAVFQVKASDDEAYVKSNKVWHAGNLVIGNYAPLASPALTGTPTAPTAATAANTAQIATTAFVKAQGYLTSAPVTSVASKTGAVTLVASDVGALPIGGGTMTGDINTNGNSIQINVNSSTRMVKTSGSWITGGGDAGASTTDSNLRLHSWYGIGFAPSISGQTIPQGENAVYINVRNGDLTARGTIKGNRLVLPVGANLYAT